MPSSLRELRVAVGGPNARRSTVWKFSVNKSDVYIFSRMFGADSKVSLHALGDCQWSNTSKWVTKVSGRRNADRHIQRWNVPRPNGPRPCIFFASGSQKANSVKRAWWRISALFGGCPRRQPVRWSFLSVMSRPHREMTLRSPATCLTASWPPCRSRTAVGSLCSIASSRATSGGWNPLGHK
jgi:hypothetical protein